MKKVTTFPFSPHVSEFKTVLDSRIRIPAFRIPIVSGIPEFLELYSRFQSPGLHVPQKKISRILGSVSLTWGSLSNHVHSSWKKLGLWIWVNYSSMNRERIGSNRLIKLSAFRNLWNFYLWNLESGTCLFVSWIWILALESIIQLNESGIPLTIKIPESKVRQWQRIKSPALGIRNLQLGIQNQRLSLGNSWLKSLAFLWIVKRSLSLFFPQTSWWQEGSTVRNISNLVKYKEIAPKVV